MERVVRVMLERRINDFSVTSSLRWLDTRSKSEHGCSRVPQSSPNRSSALMQTAAGKHGGKGRR
jgi:hypothetical protein